MCAMCDQCIYLVLQPKSMLGLPMVCCFSAFHHWQTRHKHCILCWSFICTRRMIYVFFCTMYMEYEQCCGTTMLWVVMVICWIEYAYADVYHLWRFHLYCVHGVWWKLCLQMVWYWNTFSHWQTLDLRLYILTHAISVTFNQCFVCDRTVGSDQYSVCWWIGAKVLNHGQKQHTIFFLFYVDLCFLYSVRPMLPSVPQT